MFTKINLGISYSSAISRALSVPTCSDVVASTTIIDEAAARVADITSPSKSKYPGVSIKLYLWSLYSIVLRPSDDVILGASVGFEILFVFPTVYKKASIKFDFPEPEWPNIATFLILSDS